MVNPSLKPVTQFLNIPTPLCIKLLKEKHFFRACQLWLFLKSRCRGQMMITPELRRGIAKELGVSERTVRNELNKLYGRNWLGYNPKSKITFVRGFDAVMKIEQLSGRSAAWISVKQDISDFKQCKGIIKSIVLGYFANKQKWKEVLGQKESEQRKGSSNQNSKRPSTSTHFPISCNAMIKLFGISNGSASNYKRLAQESGGIDVKKNLQKIKGVNSGKGIPAKFSAVYKIAFPDIAHKVRIIDGFLFLQGPDLIQPLLEYKRRRNSN